MTRLLLSFLSVFLLTLTLGCGGDTEPTVITGDVSEDVVAQETEDYEAEMDEEGEGEGDGDE